MMDARELTKRYGDNTAVHSLRFTIAPGTVTGFLGPNGAGSVSLLERVGTRGELTTTSQAGGKVNGPTSTSTPSSPRSGQTRATEQTHNRRPKPEVETARAPDVQVEEPV